MTDTKPDIWDMEARRVFPTMRLDYEITGPNEARHTLAAALRLAHEQGVTAGKIELMESMIKEMKGENACKDDSCKYDLCKIVNVLRKRLASLRAPAKGKGE